MLQTTFAFLKAPDVDDGLALEIRLGIDRVQGAQDQDIAAFDDLLERQNVWIARYERIRGQDLVRTFAGCA